MTQPQPDRVERSLGLVLLVLIAYRLAYHATYLGEVAFAHATFSDGAVYEQAARDILQHPPLGSRAFYLQGAYSYLLALGMSIRAWPSFGLLVQLLLACATWYWFHRCATSLWGRRAGQLSSIALLAHPGLAFYENKYLSAELGFASNVLVLLAFVALLRAGFDDERSKARLRACLGLGLASGLAILARPNLVLAIPFTLMGMVALSRRDGPPTRPATLALSGATFVLGLLLALAPMAARNLAVTGHADVGPIHGGGTSFFIGNNPKSKGVWNDGGLLSANLGTESAELVEALSIDPTLSERDRARAIGDALYRRAFDWIAENPGDWVVLELRKLWLVIGDQQMTQDYDWLGERELLPWAHRIGVSFSLLLALGILGAGALVRGRWQPASPALVREAAPRRALAWFLLGQFGAPLAANLLYFTSAQHRLPLVLPLALLAGPGLLALVETLRGLREDKSRAWKDRALPAWLLPVVLLALVQGPWPRNRVRTPHSVHYYNLSMAQDSVGEPRDALASMDKAIELRPDSAIFRQRRAHLRVRLLDPAGAAQDLAVIDQLAATGGVPEWVLREASLDRATLQIERPPTNE